MYPASKDKRIKKTKTNAKTSPCSRWWECRWARLQWQHVFIIIFRLLLQLFFFLISISLYRCLHFLFIWNACFLSGRDLINEGKYNTWADAAIFFSSFIIYFTGTWCFYQHDSIISRFLHYIRRRQHFNKCIN